MTLTTLISKLTELRDIHGPDVEVKILTGRVDRKDIFDTTLDQGLNGNEKDQVLLS